jgi:hypothetical protein
MLISFLGNKKRPDITRKAGKELLALSNKKGFIIKQALIKAT